nr:lysozyme g-like protein 1 isoform X1 [Dasypus novemcinctus]
MIYCCNYCYFHIFQLIFILKLFQDLWSQIVTMSALWLLLGLLAFPSSAESSDWGCYGNIRTFDTPGASCGIGRRQGLNYCGVRASERLAEIDMPYLLRYQPVMRTVGQKYCVDPAVIAGVLSRQLHGGKVLVNVGSVGDRVGMVQVSTPPARGGVAACRCCYLLLLMASLEHSLELRAQLCLQRQTVAVRLHLEPRFLFEADWAMLPGYRRWSSILNFRGGSGQGRGERLWC